MAPVFTAGLETGDLTEFTGSTGSPTSSTDQAREGSRSLKITAASTNVYKTLTGANVYYLRFYVYFLGLPNANTGQIIVARLCNVGTYLCGIQVYNSSGSVKWRGTTRENTVDVNTLSSGANVAAGQWYCVEMLCDCSSADGTADGNYRFYINGVEDTSLQRLNKDTDYTQVTRAYLGAYISNTDPDTFYIDSIVVDTSYIGPIPSGPKKGNAHTIMMELLRRGDL